MINIGWKAEEHIFELMDSIQPKDLQMAVTRYFDENQSTDAILVPKKIQAKEGDAHANQ